MMVDASVYPDWEQPPGELKSPGEKAEYLHRVCSAMDFRVFPDGATMELLAGWREIFERYPLPASPAYRALYYWFGWGQIEVPRGLPALRPAYLAMDAAEGRGEDPCEAMV